MPLSTSSRFVFALAALLGAISLRGQNLLVNGAFSSTEFNGDLHLWSNSSNGESVSWYNLKLEMPDAVVGWSYAPGASPEDDYYTNYNSMGLSGANFIGFGAGGSQAGGTLSQDFNVLTGQTYTASLDVAYLGAGESVGLIFSVYNGATLVNSATFSTATQNLTGAFVTQSFSFTAPSANLRFVVQDLSTSGPNTDVAFDNASVTLAAVPEPSTYAALAGLAALGLALHGRRRRRAD